MSREKDLRRVEHAMVQLNRIARSGRADALRARRARTSLPGGAQRMLHQAVERGPVRPAELARHTGTDPGIVTRQVDVLEREGLVERRPDPEDGRALLLHATAGGRRVAARLRRVQDEIFEDLLAGWSATELEELADLMERLARDLHAT